MRAALSESLVPRTPEIHRSYAAARSVGVTSNRLSRPSRSAAMRADSGSVRAISKVSSTGATLMDCGVHKCGFQRRGWVGGAERRPGTHDVARAAIVAYPRELRAKAERVSMSAFVKPSRVCSCIQAIDAAGKWLILMSLCPSWAGFICYVHSDFGSILNKSPAAILPRAPAAERRHRDPARLRG